MVVKVRLLALSLGLSLGRVGAASFQPRTADPVQPSATRKKPIRSPG